MNESELENELRALLPAAPSPALEKRIAAEISAHAITVASPRILDQAPTSGVIARSSQPSPLMSLLRGLLWAGAGAAVATVILLNRAPQPQTPPALPVAAATQDETIIVSEMPEQMVTELIESTDEGLVYNEDTPQRQMRLTYLERHTWTNPKTGAVIEFEVPREDIVLMPVAMQ
jgi:hypothetical protein